MSPVTPAAAPASDLRPQVPKSLALVPVAPVVPSVATPLAVEPTPQVPKQTTTHKVLPSPRAPLPPPQPSSGQGSLLPKSTATSAKPVAKVGAAKPSATSAVAAKKPPVKSSVTSGQGSLLPTPTGGARTKVVPPTKQPIAAKKPPSSAIPASATVRKGSAASSTGGPGTASARSALTLISLQKESDKWKRQVEGLKKQVAANRKSMSNSVVVVGGMGVMIRYLTEHLDAFSNPLLCARLEAAHRATRQVERAAEEREAALKASLAEKDAHQQELSDEIVNWSREYEVVKARHLKEKDKLLEMHESEMKLLECRLQAELQKERDKESAALERIKEREVTIEELRKEVAGLQVRQKELEDSLKQDKDKRVRALREKCQRLEAEVSSLNVVLELRDDSISKMRGMQMELEARCEELVPTRAALKVVKQKLEQLEITLDHRQETIKALTEENETLKAATETTFRDRKRLSLRNEELEFALTESFYGTPVGTPFKVPGVGADGTAVDYASTPIRVPLHANPFNYVNHVRSVDSKMSQSCVDLGGPGGQLNHSRSAHVRRRSPAAGHGSGPSSLPVAVDGEDLSLVESGPKSEPVADTTKVSSPRNDGTFVRRPKTERRSSLTTASDDQDGTVVNDGNEQTNKNTKPRSQRTPKRSRKSLPMTAAMDSTPSPVVICNNGLDSGVDNGFGESIVQGLDPSNGAIGKTA